MVKYLGEGPIEEAGTTPSKGRTVACPCPTTTPSAQVPHPQSTLIRRWSPLAAAAQVGFSTSLTLPWKLKEAEETTTLGIYQAAPSKFAALVAGNRASSLTTAREGGEKGGRRGSCPNDLSPFNRDASGRLLPGRVFIRGLLQKNQEKLLSSKNRTEASLAKRLKIDVLPEIEKIQKRKERTLKKQHRQALLLDTFITADRLAAGRSLRDRKPVTYTFDAFDRSINEAIKITKKRQHYLDPAARSEFISKPDGTTNGRVNGPTRVSNKVSVDTSSPKSTDNEETDGEHISGSLDRRNRRRQRPQWYSEFVEGVSDNDTEFDSDDDIIGEAVYDEEYLRYRKQRKALNSSAGDEYRNGKMGEDDDEEEYEEEEEEDSPGVTMEGRGSGVPTKPPRSRRETKLRSMDEIESGLRRSKRPVKNRIDYSHYEFSDVEAHSSKADKPDSTVRRSIASDSVDYSMESDDSQQDEEVLEKNNNGSSQYLESTIRDSSETLAKLNSPGQDIDGQGERKFLDLNLLAPGIGFDDRTGGGMVGDGKNS